MESAPPPRRRAARGGGLTPGLRQGGIPIDVTEYPAEWFEGVPKSMYLSKRYNIPTNKYKVKAGQDQEFWESKGWIDPQDPRGWFQW